MTWDDEDAWISNRAWSEIKDEIEELKRRLAFFEGHTHPLPHSSSLRVASAYTYSGPPAPNQTNKARGSSLVEDWHGKATEPHISTHPHGKACDGF